MHNHCCTLQELTQVLFAFAFPQALKLQAQGFLNKAADLSPILAIDRRVYWGMEKWKLVGYEWDKYA